MTDNAYIAASPTPDLKSWSYLAGEATSGRLSLDPTVSKDCADACDELTAVLERVQRKVRSLDHDIGLGDFECGKQLSHILRDMAVGPDGMHQRLREHTEVVKQIRETVTGQVARVQAQDDQTAHSLHGKLN